MFAVAKDGGPSAWSGVTGTGSVCNQLDLLQEASATGSSRSGAVKKASTSIEDTAAVRGRGRFRLAALRHAARRV